MQTDSFLLSSFYSSLETSICRSHSGLDPDLSGIIRSSLFCFPFSGEETRLVSSDTAPRKTKVSRKMRNPHWKAQYLAHRKCSPNLWEAQRLEINLSCLFEIGLNLQPCFL